MKGSVAFKKVSKRLSYRKRYLSLSSIEQIRVRRLQKLLLAMMCKIKILKDKIEIERLNGKLRKLIFVYFGMITTVDEGLDKCDRYDRTIRSFTASDCKLMLEFKKADLISLRYFSTLATLIASVDISLCCLQYTLVFVLQLSLSILLVS